MEWLLFFLIFFIFLIFLTARRTTEDDVARLRPIPAFDTIKQLLTQSAETGRRLHLSLGNGSVATPDNADTLAGLALLSHVSEQASTYGEPPIVTLADPTTLLVAQNATRLAYQNDKQAVGEAIKHIYWLSPNPAAYAVGTMGIMSRQTTQIEGNILLGHFGEEYLLMGETTQQQHSAPLAVSGASDLQVLPFVLATSEKGLWGEEIFAAGAYLSRKPFHLASLFAQDTIRWLLGLGILGGVILKTIGII